MSMLAAIVTLRTFFNVPGLTGIGLMTGIHPDAVFPESSGMR
jgi:hypothetical protein